MKNKKNRHRTYLLLGVSLSVMAASVLWASAPIIAAQINEQTTTAKKQADSNVKKSDGTYITTMTTNFLIWFDSVLNNVFEKKHVADKNQPQHPTIKVKLMAHGAGANKNDSKTLSTTIAVVKPNDHSKKSKEQPAVTRAVKEEKTSTRIAKRKKAAAILAAEEKKAAAKKTKEIAARLSAVQKQQRDADTAEKKLAAAKLIAEILQEQKEDLAEQRKKEAIRAAERRAEAQERRQNDAANAAQQRLEAAEQAAEMRKDAAEQAAKKREEDIERAIEAREDAAELRKKAAERDNKNAKPKTSSKLESTDNLGYVYHVRPDKDFAIASSYNHSSYDNSEQVALLTNYHGIANC